MFRHMLTFSRLLLGWLRHRDSMTRRPNLKHQLWWPIPGQEWLCMAILRYLLIQRGFEFDEDKEADPCYLESDDACF